jgi:hypothetical protein
MYGNDLDPDEPLNAAESGDIDAGRRVSRARSPEPSRRALQL